MEDSWEHIRQTHIGIMAASLHGSIRDREETNLLRR